MNAYAPPMGPKTMFRQIMGALFPSLLYSEFEYKHLVPASNLFMRLIREMGYFHLQATKPDTVGTLSLQKLITVN